MLAGGWGASRDADGKNGFFSSGTGEVFNIPVELAESRGGLQITKYGFHDEDGGGGQYRGGKGIELSFEITSDEAFLTYMASQTRTRPWALHGGMEGSFNRAELLRIEGTKDTFTLVNGACAKRGDVFSMLIGTSSERGRVGEGGVRSWRYRWRG